MTLDHAVALSLFDDELPKLGLTARLMSDDPELLELATSRLEEAREVRGRAEQVGIHALAWSDPSFPPAFPMFRNHNYWNQEYEELVQIAEALG